MKKEPFVTKTQLDEIVKEYPTPFHLYDEKGIRENVKALKEAFAWNKGYKEYFAVKATPNPYILNILKEYGCGCDCSSYTELLMSESVGQVGENIMFSSNDTPEEEFKYANEIGGIINLDDITHIESVERAVGYIPKVISCRYNPGGVFKISNDIMDNPGDAKYGMTTEQIFEAFKILKEKGAEEFGIHAFLASNTVTNEYYPMLAKEMFEMAVKLQKETGAHVKFINLSGGVGIAYKPDQTPNDIREIGEGVRKVYEEVLVPAGMGDVAIYTEMGRFMMGPYGCLVTKAIHEKHTHKEYIGVDACAVNLMRPAMYGAYHHITVMGKEDQPCDHMYDVTGSLCENNDKFAIDRYLPKVDMGDLLVIHDTGAHGFAMGYNYNGKLKSSEILLHEDGSFEMIRRAETPKDYFATFDCFPIYEKLPIISAVGHETDFTIADFAADLRAPTPSAAAELAVDDYRSVIEAVSIYRQRLYRAMSGKMDLYRSRLEHFQTKFAYLSPENRLREQRQRLADLENAVQNGMNRKLQDERHRLSVYLERFAGLSPLKKLNQGYSYVADKYKKTLTSVEQVQNGDTIYISVTDGTIEADVTGTVKEEKIYGEERKL